MRRALRIFAVLIFGSLGASARAVEDIQALYAAAKQEGKLVYWGSPDSKTATRLTADFNKKYPGIAVEVFKIQPAPAIERIISTTAAGRPEADVVDSQLAYVKLLFDRGLIASYAWSDAFGIDPGRVLFDGKAISIWHLDTPIAINTSVVKAGDIKSWDDLLDRKYAQKLIVEARGFAFAILALAWGEQKAFDYLKAIVAQKPIITKGGTATLEALASGQGAAAIGGYAGIVEQSKAAGAPIDWVRAGPVPTAYAVLMQLSNAPHPNAARLWANFMTSKEAHDAIYDGQGLDLVFGRDIGDLGKKYAAAKLEVVPETTDVDRMQALVTRAGAIIGSIQ